MRPAVARLVEAAATPLAWILRAGAALGRLPLRLVRLARLKARCRGRVPATLRFDGPVHVVGRPRISFGDYCRLGRDVVIETAGDAAITLGDHVRVNGGSFLIAHAGITIGSHTLIGEHVSLRDADHGILPGALIRTQPHVGSPIEIGEDAWIGRGAVVLKGVRVGRGAIVGANSVVTRDVPDMTIAAGVPARPLRRRGEAKST
jgi:acetyltransferase-like isoleucine patch superfamily enzyme